MKIDQEKWRLILNGTLTLVLAPLVFSISGTLYLSSNHRFVTNPSIEEFNGTTLKEVEPGLGESEFMYSLLVTILSCGEVVGGLMSGFFTKCIPHWYQFMFAISLHTIGYVLYGVATNGWVLMVGMFLAGYYLGAQITLSMTYATELSVKYVNLTDKENVDSFDYEKKVVKTRNFLFAVHSIGYSVGYVVGPAISIMFSSLPIEQYRSIAWFNVACGILLLGLFGFLFHGEGSWKSINRCEMSVCSHKNKDVRPGSLQIFIIVSMHFLAFVQLLKWSYFEALMNPVLSDSFGFKLQTSSFVFLGVAFSSILGTLLLVCLQRIKMSTQMITFIGIAMTILGYLLVADWQTIPYDPCTEFSPFHHPGRFENYTVLRAYTKPTALYTPTTVPVSINVQGSMDVKMNFDNLTYSKSSLSLNVICRVDKHCPFCTDNFSKPCLSLHVNEEVPSKYHNTTYYCSLQYPSLCVNIIYNQTVARSNKELSKTSHIQNFQVLQIDEYYTASNACINANVSVGECQWIPFASGEKCEDCPPICRAKQRTLLLPLYLIGMILLIGSYPLVWVTLVAIANNQSPESVQGIVIGSINAANGFAESVSPVLVDVLYEQSKKRTFVPSILFSILHIPFLIEIVVLYKYLGPSYEHSKYRIIKSKGHLSDTETD